MSSKTILPLVVTLAIAMCPPAYAGEAPKPASKEAETGAEAEARAEYEAAEKAARDAEAALAPLRKVMQQADAAYAEAKKTANAKRRKADRAKALAGEQGVKELEQAEAKVPAAAKALSEATEAKPPLDQALAEAKAAAAPLQEAYDAAEEVAKEAEAKAKAARDAADKLDNEAKRAEAQAKAKRRAVEAAHTALERARQGEEKLQGQAKAAAEKLAELQARKESGGVTEEALAQAKSQKELLETALASVEKQVASAAKTAEAAEQAAQAAAKAAEEKKQSAAQAAAKRKAAADAGAALAKAKEDEKQSRAQASAAAKALAEAKGEDRAEAEAEKEAADQALAEAKAEVAAATDANEKARAAAKQLLELDAAAKEAEAEAAAKRKVANEAKAALAPKAKALEQSLVKANAAKRALDRAQKRKKAAEEALASLKKRIAAAKETHEADEKAAQEAEAAAAPLKVEAEKSREEFMAARQVANEKRELAQQAKAAWYRLVAARKIGDVMESSDPPKPANGIDEIIFAKLKSLGIQPRRCSDAVFVRRAFLDLTGKLPAAEEAKAFMQSSDENKRLALVDRLLERSTHFDYWAMKWSDILRVKAEYPVKVWPNAAQAYHRWIWGSIAQNKPYDQFARELLTSSGSNYRVGSVNFYRAIQNKTPEGIASAVGLALMGARIHHWPEERRAGMAVFFSQVGYKPTSEWKEEIVFWDPLNSTEIPGSITPGYDAVAKGVTATNQIPRGLDEPLSPNGPLEAVFPDGTKTTIPPHRDPRQVFADWLIQADNPWFAKAIVNRTWAWAMGRGIIHEADDIREDNPPSNSELLGYLEKELVSSGYDLKHLKRLIFTSAAYQFSPISRSDKPEARANFASYRLRRVEAEVLNDALNQITGSSDLYTSAVPEPFTYIPDAMSAVELADGSISSSFLTLFGRSARATGMENERVNELASPQWLHMLNSGTIQNKLQNGPKLRAMISAGGEPKEIAERLYLTVLSRLPTDAEVEAAEEHAKAGVAKGRNVWIDLAWALINSPEFLLRH
ncbi:MAG: DUF1553 domain-containing protein [Pirellulaceae bacterium]